MEEPFVTDIPARGICGLNPYIFIAFMSSYEGLLVSLLSTATVEVKREVQRLFLLHCDWNILYDRWALQREGITNGCCKLLLHLSIVLGKCLPTER